MAQGLQALTAANVDVNAISVIGGGSRSLYWGRILSAALQRPLIYREGAAAGPAYGAARLALYGHQGGDIEDVFKAPKALEIVEPRDHDIELLNTKIARSASLYEALAGQFNGGS